MPDGTDYWDFASRFGQDSDTAESMKSAGIVTTLDSVLSNGWSHCYVEIIATAKQKKAAPTPEVEDVTNKTLAFGSIKPT